MIKRDGMDTLKGPKLFGGPDDGTFPLSRFPLSTLFSFTLCPKDVFFSFSDRQRLQSSPDMKSLDRWSSIFRFLIPGFGSFLLKPAFVCIFTVHTDENQLENGRNQTRGLRKYLNMLLQRPRDFMSGPLVCTRYRIEFDFAQNVISLIKSLLLGPQEVNCYRIIRSVLGKVTCVDLLSGIYCAPNHLRH